MLGVLIKKKFYNKLVPPSDILTYVNKQAFEKVVLGSVFMVGYFKSPDLIAKHGGDYVIANRILLEDQHLVKALQESGSTYSFPVINESQIGYAMLIGAYSYIAFKFYQGMRDMHAFKGKE
jgi:hypothetical protein